jgi:hypothetical protein
MILSSDATAMLPKVKKPPTVTCCQSEKIYLEFFIALGSTENELQGHESYLMTATSNTTLEYCANWIGFKLAKKSEHYRSLKLYAGDHGLQTFYFDKIRRRFWGNTASVGTMLFHNQPIMVKYDSLVTSKHPEPTCGQIKYLIWLKTGIPIHQQMLLRYGERVDDNALLESYNIHDDNTFDLILSQSGGGGARFVDVTRSDALQSRAWSKTAPDWRCKTRALLGRGLQKQGVHCIWERRVICNKNFQVFDLLAKDEMSQCPMCTSVVIPTTAGFNNCFWRTTTVKESSPDGTILSPWKRAGNSYNTFDEIIAGTCSFLRLQIFTRPIDPSGTMCAIFGRNLLSSLSEKTKAQVLCAQLS